MGRLLATALAALLVFAACSGGGGTAAPGGASASPGGGTSASPGGSAFDPNSIEGDLLLQGFSAGQVEDELLNKVLATFMTKYPKIKVRFETIADKYETVMLAKLSAGDPPDLFYVQQGYSQDWIEQGVLQELSTYAQERGFDTSKFVPAFSEPFIGQDAKVYGFPKDSSILAMQVNTDLLAKAGVTTTPTTTDELVAAAEKLKVGGVKTPMCFAAEFARAGAFVRAFGGWPLSEDKTQATIDTPEAREGLNFYVDQIKKGNAGRPVDIGVGWCGQAFGEQKAAISFEGNWIQAYLKNDFPAVKYEVAPIPSAKQQATLSYTAAYSMGVDSKNKDASWVLLTYLTGQEGMQEWVDGGLVLPARTDVTGPADKKVYSDSASFAAPGEGLVPGWAGIAKAFNDSLVAAIEGSGSVDDIIAKTKAATEKALQGQ